MIEKISKILAICFLLVLSILIGVNAQCGNSDAPCSDNWEKFDYANPNADITKVPPDKLDMQKTLTNDRGADLSLEQIGYAISNGNIDQVGDIVRDLDASKFEQVWLNEYGVELSLGQGASLQKGFLSATYGNKGSIHLSEISKGASVVIDNDGNVIVTGETKPPAKGSFTLNNEGAEITRMPNGEIKMVEREATIIKTPNGNEYNFKGELSFEDGQAYIKEGDYAAIDNIEISSIRESTSLCESETCSGNYFRLDEKEMEAECIGCLLRFRQDNGYFQVIEKDTEIGFTDIKNQNDLLKIYVGNSENPGEVHVNTQENLLPEITTDGWVRIHNNHNTLTIEEDKVTKNSFFSEESLTQEAPATFDAGGNTKGSVHSALIAGDDGEKVYVFDESRNLYIVPEENYASMNAQRAILSEKYGMSLIGYYSQKELDLFMYGLSGTENNIGLDMKKISEQQTGGKISIFELDNDFRNPDFRAFVSAEGKTTFPMVVWTPFPEDNLKTGSRIDVEKWEPSSSEYATTLPHELSHVLFDNWEFAYSYKKLLEDNGMTMLESYIEKGPDHLFPTEYSHNFLTEHMAEMFATMAVNPDWFTDSTIPESARMERQTFRDLYLKELEKYKK